MHRQSDINQAFRESVLRNSKGFQYLHTKDFVSALRRRGIHFTEVEANGRDGTRADCRANQSGFSRRMLENGATRQQVADVIGVDVKTIYKYLPAT